MENTKMSILYSIETDGDYYGPEEISSEAFDRYIDIAEREISAYVAEQYPEIQVQFQTVPETVSHNNRSQGADDVLDAIGEFVGRNWFDWMEEAGA